MTSVDELDELLTPDEVAAFFKTNRRWVYEATARGDLVAIRVGRFLRYSREDVKAFLERGRHG